MFHVPCFMEEGGIIGQLGINWKLFLSQAVNFFILLLILRAFVYKPLLVVIKKRNERIKEGLEKADEADVRLKEIDVIAKKSLKKAEAESMMMMKATEEKAKQLEQTLSKKAEEKQQHLLQQLQVEHAKQQEDVKRKVSKEAAELVKKFIVKTVGLKPEAIDNALIEQAITHVNKSK